MLVVVVEVVVVVVVGVGGWRSLAVIKEQKVCTWFNLLLRATLRTVWCQ